MEFHQNLRSWLCPRSENAAKRRIALVTDTGVGKRCLDVDIKQIKGQVVLGNIAKLKIAIISIAEKSMICVRSD